MSDMAMSIDGFRWCRFIRELGVKSVAASVPGETARIQGCRVKWEAGAATVAAIVSPPSAWSGLPSESALFSRQH